MTGSRPGGDHRELILYATPTGPLALAIDAYFAAVTTELGRTTAQTYPPHCTLTGFFQRDDADAVAAIDEIGLAVADAGPVPDDAVDVVGLTITDDWVGLELRSPWLIALTSTIASRHQPPTGRDALRVKDWLHLSLAYGISDLGPHAELAADLVDPDLGVGWDVALWERRPGGAWTRHDQTAS